MTLHTLARPALHCTSGYGVGVRSAICMPSFCCTDTLHSLRLVACLVGFIPPDEPLAACGVMLTKYAIIGALPSTL